MRLTVPLVVAALLAGAVRAGAQPLPADVVPDQYELRFAFDLAHDAFTGVEQILVNVDKPTSRITLNARGLTLKQATIVSGWSSQPATIAADESHERVTLSVRRRLAPGPARIRIEYTGRLGRSPHGFFSGASSGRAWAASQFESSDARHAFPCFDQPDMKASFLITAVVPTGDTVISNGRVLSDTPGPGENEHTVKFATTRKVSTYVAALAVGDFQCLDGQAGDVPIRVCALRGNAPRARFALEAAQSFLGFYQGYFTAKYPFGKLDLVAIPGFPGGMENAGAIFFGERDLLVDPDGASVEAQKLVATTIAHEIAHQWIGDLVTMKWWDDLWLKEGFATFFETKPILAWRPAWHVEMDEVASAEQAMAYDSLEVTRPARSKVTTPAQIDDSYDPIAYQKAGAVLRMVEAAMGPETFRGGVNAFIKRFSYSNATGEDFWTTMSENDPRGVDQVLRTFVVQPGVPVVSVTTRCVTDATSALTLTQQRFWTDPKRAAASSPVWAVPVATRPLAPPPGVPAVSTTRVFAAKDQTFDLAGCSPLVLGNAGAAGYFRTAYPSEVLARLTKEAEGRLTPVERLRLLDDQWAIAGSGREIGQYLSLVSSFAADPSEQILDRIGETLRAIADNVATDATRGPFRAWVRSVFRADPPAAPPDGATGTERREIRAGAATILGQIGRDPDLVGRARGAVSGEIPPVDPTLLDALTQVAATSGDLAVFERITANIANAPSEEVYERNVGALGEFTDADFVARALNYALSEHVHPADAARVMAAALRNAAARPIAWPFVKAHWRELVSKSGPDETGTAILNAAGSFCDAGLRDDVKSFLESRGLGGNRALEQTLDRIQACIDFKTVQQPNLQRWLASRTDGSR